MTTPSPPPLLHRLFSAAMRAGIGSENHIFVFTPLGRGYLLRAVEKKTGKLEDHFFRATGSTAEPGTDREVHDLDDLSEGMQSDPAAEIIIRYLEAS